MTPERIEELRNKVGLNPDEACEVLDRVASLEAALAELELTMDNAPDHSLRLEAQIVIAEAQQG